MGQELWVLTQNSAEVPFPPLTPSRSHRNRLAFPGDKALFCCLSWQGALVFCVLRFWNQYCASPADWTDRMGKGSNHSLKWGTCLGEIGVFFMGNRCIIEPQKEPCFLFWLCYLLPVWSWVLHFFQFYWGIIIIHDCISVRHRAWWFHLHILGNDYHNRFS